MSFQSNMEPERHGPALLKTTPVWALVSVVCVAGASFWVSRHSGIEFPRVVLPTAVAWVLSAWATEAYRHKYPQRYISYLIAARLKMAAILVTLLSIAGILAGGGTFALKLILAGMLAMAAEFLLALPHQSIGSREDNPPLISVESNPDTVADALLTGVDQQGMIANLQRMKNFQVPGPVWDFILRNLEEAHEGLTSVHISNDDSVKNTSGPVGLLVHTRPLNSIRRLNLFLNDLPAVVSMGGYFAFSYRPLEEDLERLKESKAGPSLWFSYMVHFLWYRALPKTPILERIYFWKPLAFLDNWLYKRTGDKRRVLARAESWGRMAFWGFEVLAEEKIGEAHWVVARRIAEPERERKPSFFLVVALTKIGLDGIPLRLHKLRTMYPFSEFIQAKLYREHGLSETGKFKNDFRLTDYGRFLRRYWLDEIPQLWDWFRGDIKLVGMRATSPHFLSLYPEDFIELYIRTKPGLIPPIFDESTSGFDDIVRIELQYLRSYQRSPIRTDIRYFFRTFHDIVFRGVRSK